MAITPLPSSGQRDGAPPRLARPTRHVQPGGPAPTCGRAPAQDTRRKLTWPARASQRASRRRDRGGRQFTGMPRHAACRTQVPMRFLSPLCPNLEPPWATGIGTQLVGAGPDPGSVARLMSAVPPSSETASGSGTGRAAAVCTLVEGDRCEASAASMWVTLTAHLRAITPLNRCPLKSPSSRRRSRRAYATRRSRPSTRRRSDLPAGCPLATRRRDAGHGAARGRSRG